MQIVKCASLPQVVWPDRVPDRGASDRRQRVQHRVVPPGPREQRRRGLPQAEVRHPEGGADSPGGLAPLSRGARCQVGHEAKAQPKMSDLLPRHQLLRKEA